jgi:glycosyltransferase involved in cell wall biosynthesis
VNRIDVVIPTYNETTNLFRAVKSVKDQTFRVDKIWIIDDGSEESIVNTLKSAFEGDCQIEILTLSHSGAPGLSRKHAISKSSAEWIAFLDADDYWEKTKIERQMECAREFRADFVYTNALQIGDGETKPYFSSADFESKISFHQLLRQNKVINSSVLVRRETLEHVGGYAHMLNVRAVEDYATWLRISSKKNLYGLEEQLTVYQVSPKSLSREAVPDRRLFALTDFLVWCANQNSRGAGERLRLFSLRVLTLLQMIREMRP